MEQNRMESCKWRLQAGIETVEKPESETFLYYTVQNTLPQRWGELRE
jgi:hypothetical protein